MDFLKQAKLNWISDKIISYKSDVNSEISNLNFWKCKDNYITDDFRSDLYHSITQVVFNQIKGLQRMKLLVMTDTEKEFDALFAWILNEIS